MSLSGDSSATSAVLTPFDREEVEAGLAGTQFAGQVVHLPSVGSTNVLAIEAALAGAPAGVWVADEQTAGRGRGGHGWHSAAGEGLYVSALLASALPMRVALWISLATGLAAQAAIGETTGKVADIRWPNDLLLNGRKCGGILVETAVQAGAAEAEAMLRYAVIGIGINLNHQSFPSELESVATSLRRETGAGVSRNRFLVSLLRHLDVEVKRLVDQARGAASGPGVLQRFAQASTWVLGKQVSVGESGGYTGVTAGLDERGFLLVDGDDGVRHTVLSGGVRAR